MDVVPIFQERIRPSSTFGIPDIVFLPGAICIFCFLAAYAIFTSIDAPIWIPILITAIGTCSLIYTLRRWYLGSELLIHDMNIKGQAVSKRPMVSLKPFSFFETFCWRKPLDRQVVKHHDGALSVMFSWAGQYNEFFSEQAFEESMSRYNQLIKLLGDRSEYHLTLEMHFDRRYDDTAVNQYLRVGEKTNTDKTPKIVRDIRLAMANKMRGKGFNNRVFGVLSMYPSKPISLKQLVMNASIEPLSAREKACKAALLETASLVEKTLDGFKLLSVDDYYKNVSTCLLPFESPTAYNSRQCFSEQVAYYKPLWDETAQCLKQGNTYIKPVLLFKYSELSPGWFFDLSRIKTCVHVSQIMQPKVPADVLHKTRKDITNKQVFSSEDQHNWDDALHELSDAQGYCEFVKHHYAGVADNCYLVVFYSDVDHLSQMQDEYKSWASLIKQDGGELRSEHDMQYALFLYQAPGMGRYSKFFREDNGFVIGRMLPDTVYDAGDPEPEILRLCSNGQLYGYSPSKEIVLGQLIAGQTGGGKDSQFGLSVLETYQSINYTLFEEGNSYQIIVEALGGKYCEAVSQIINPLSSYEDYQRIKTKENGNHNFIGSMRVVLLPIFKGFNHNGFSREEEVVLDHVLSLLYEHPLQDRQAPILPDLEKLLDNENTLEEEYRTAQAQLHKDLRSFLRTSEGKPFCKEDQFVLSPIINAINFEGLNSTLLRYYLGFMTERVSMQAFSRSSRSQIVINEYRTLMSKAKEAIHWITLLLDRKGRKEWTGLTRITQGVDEVIEVDKESLSSMGTKNLLSRKDEHQRLGKLLKMPDSAIGVWSSFGSPKTMNQKGYREMIMHFETEFTHWQYLKLEFPKILLDLMTTAGSDKGIRFKAMKQSKDVYERIRLMNESRVKQSQSKVIEIEGVH